MQLTPDDRARDRDPHRRHRVPHARPHDPGHQHPLRRVVPPQPVPEVRQRAARARRLQRGPGQRRPLARERPGDPVRRDARSTSKQVEQLQGRLPPGVGEGAVGCGDHRPEMLELAENANTYTPLGPTDERIVDDRYVLWMGRATSRAGTSRSASACAPDEVEEVRAEIHAQLRSAGRTACTWEVGSHATPADLVERLLALGLVDDADPLAVGMVLTRAARARRRRASRCGARRERRRAASPRRGSRRSPSAGRPDRGAGAGRARSEQHRTYLAYVDGEPVARATAVVHASTARRSSAARRSRRRAAAAPTARSSRRAGRTRSRAGRRCSSRRRARCRGRSSRGSASGRSARSASCSTPSATDRPAGHVPGTVPGTCPNLAVVFAKLGVRSRTQATAVTRRKAAQATV